MYSGGLLFHIGRDRAATPRALDISTSPSHPPSRPRGGCAKSNGKRKPKKSQTVPRLDPIPPFSPLHPRHASFLNFSANGVNLGAKICSYVDLTHKRERDT